MRRDDNELLRAAERQCEYNDRAKRALDDAIAVFAFGALCLLLWAALHIGTVLP